MPTYTKALQVNDSDSINEKEPQVDSALPCTIGLKRKASLTRILFYTEILFKKFIWSVKYCFQVDYIVLRSNC